MSWKLIGTSPLFGTVYLKWPTQLLSFCVSVLVCGTRKMSSFVVFLTSSVYRIWMISSPLHPQATQSKFNDQRKSFIILQPLNCWLLCLLPRCDCKTPLLYIHAWSAFFTVQQSFHGYQLRSLLHESRLKNLCLFTARGERKSKSVRLVYLPFETIIDVISLEFIQHLFLNFQCRARATKQITTSFVEARCGEWEWNESKFSRNSSTVCVMSIN